MRIWTSQATKGKQHRQDNGPIVPSRSAPFCSYPNCACGLCKRALLRRAGSVGYNSARGLHLTREISADQPGSIWIVRPAGAGPNSRAIGMNLVGIRKGDIGPMLRIERHLEIVA